MNKFVFLIVLLIIHMSVQAQVDHPVSINSPDGSIKVKIGITEKGIPVYTVTYDNTLIIKESRIGLKLSEADLTQDLKFSGAGKIEKVSDQYNLLNDKRSNCRYDANRVKIDFVKSNDWKLGVIFQVSDDGVAFRYVISGPGKDVKHILNETTSFHFPATAKAWLHPQAAAQTGWMNTQPSYEEYYSKNIPVGTPSELGQGWSFPALFQSEGHWVLVSETGMPANYCGSHLSQQSPDGEYSIAFAQEGERTSASDPLLPESALPWETPWRTLVIGKTLAPVVESTLATDLSPSAKIKNTSFVHPGKASWSWVILKDDSTVFDVQKRFIDYASDMKWNYCLIDALWDKQIGYEKIQELADYGKTKNVGLILWYNSNGTWNNAPQTPLHKMFDPQTRRDEMARLQKMGIKGLKIDFFGGDGQSFMKYYQDILEDGAKYGLMINFHGATIPRGWTRTYPNLATMEAVRGFEFLTFEQKNTDEEPTHCAVLPFTRNAIGPMDFTPVCFSEIPHRKRKTSNGFEIALSVLFQSGIQHYAEIPSGMKKQPDYVIDFMRNLPLKWDDVKFIDGFPGEYAVIARKGNGKWYIGGINGSDSEKKITIDLSVFGKNNSGLLITDGDTNRSFSMQKYKDQNITINIKPKGGFVVRID